MSHLSKITDLDSYNYLEFIVSKENGIDYRPAGEGFYIGKSIKPPFQNKVYFTPVANLNSNSVYEICLNGMKNSVIAGYFDCKTITTQPKKQSVALIIRNYDLDSEINTLVTSWINKLKTKNDLVIHELNIPSGTTANQLYNIFNISYATSNLKYVVFIGWDIPIPKMTSWESETYSLQPYNSLFYDVINNDNGFLNSHNSLNEITTAVIRTNNADKTEMVNYFNRIIQYYDDALDYDKKILIANAMIPSESTIVKSDYVNSEYPLSDIDYLNGITSYSDYNQGLSWQNEYKNYLKNSYDFLIINAHGSPDSHLPASSPYQSSYITADFVKQANPSIKYILGISCNIGNLKSGYELSGFPSPMASYVFSGGSLVGLGAEMPYTDANGQTSKQIYQNILSGKNIGDASRRHGFVVFGDPFISN